MIANDVPANLAMYQSKGRGTASVTTAQALPTIPSGATIARVQAGAVLCRMTVDGTTPSATVGVNIPVLGHVYIFGAKDIKAALIFAGSASVIEVSYFG